MSGRELRHVTGADESGLLQKVDDDDIEDVFDDLTDDE